MKKIPLSQGKFAIIDDSDYAEVSNFKWYAHKAKTTWYACKGSRVNGKGDWISLHRFLMRPVGNTQVDHINHNGLDCRRENMRNATNTQNRWNHKKRLSDRPFIGVSLKSGRFVARIKTNGKNSYLGSFTTANEAASAYDKAVVERRGSFAMTNLLEVANV